MDKGRINHVDSIRGIAALLVVYMHVSEVFIRQFPAVKGNGTLLYDIARSVDFGRIGVIAFFAISGFVICSSLKGERGFVAAKFLVSRFFRSYPTFWFSIVAVVAVSY